MHYILLINIANILSLYFPLPDFILLTFLHLLSYFYSLLHIHYMAHFVTPPPQLPYIVLFFFYLSTLVQLLLSEYHHNSIKGAKLWDLPASLSTELQASLGLCIVLQSYRLEGAGSPEKASLPSKTSV